MPETAGDTTTEEESPSQASRRKSQSRLIAIAVSGSTNNALLTSIVPLFLLSLGASPFVIGIAATRNHIQKMGRVVGLQFMHRTGKAGLFFWGRVGSLPAGIALALLAYQGGAGVWAAWIGLAVFTIRGTVQQMGNTAWWPLVQDNTASGGIGSFLTRMRLQQRLLELVLALFSTFAGAFLAHGVAEKAQPIINEGLLPRLRQVIAEPPMRAYAFFIMARTAVLSATFPLWVVALTDWGLPVRLFRLDDTGAGHGLYGRATRLGADGRPPRQPQYADHHLDPASSNGPGLAIFALRSPVNRAVGEYNLLSLGCVGRRSSNGPVTSDARCRFQRIPGRRFCHRYLRLCAGRLRRRHHRWLPLPVGTGTSRCKRPTLLSDSRATHFCRHLALEQAANWLSRTDFGALLIPTALDLAVTGPVPYYLMPAYEAYSLRLPLDI